MRLEATASQQSHEIPVRKIVLNRIRSIVGVIVYDLTTYCWNMLARRTGYLRICNRAERLVAAHDMSGFQCDWRWTSDLHAPRILPSLGRWLLRKALQDHPIVRRTGRDSSDRPTKVSFIVGHRGVSRLSLLLATIESIAGQSNVDVECVVVEQDVHPLVRNALPAWVRYVHVAVASGEPYSRAWAFNVGARVASGDILVLHDNDLLVPSDYADILSKRVAAGYDVVNVKRFIFYLSEAQTEDYLSGRLEIVDTTPATVMQNAQAGGSIAITSRAFDSIGGMDESFVGWGGEDNEFWERAATRTVWGFGCLSLVHLWHAAQPLKQSEDNPMLRLYYERSRVPAELRIARLCALERGNRNARAEHNQTLDYCPHAKRPVT